MRILVRGGSIPAGHGVTRGYVQIVKEVFAGTDTEVVNRSGFRETTFDGVRTFYQEIDVLKPDVLLLHFGVDDAFQVVYRSEFQENTVQMIRLARERFDPIVVLATAQTFDDPYDMDAVSIYYRSLRIVAEDLKCEFVPVHHHWAGYLEENRLKSADLVLADPRYPNELGHEVIAEAVFPRLRAIVSGNTSRT